MKQSPEYPIRMQIPVPGIDGNGKSKAIEILEENVVKLDERIRKIELGDCPLGKSHDEEIKIMRARIHELNNQLMIFIGQRQAIQWLPQLIQTAVMLAGFWILYVHGK